MRIPPILASLAIASLAAGLTHAQPNCTVPGSHATIQAAVDEEACATIQLANQTYEESVNIPRTLDLLGPAAGTAVIRGLLRVAGPGTLVDVAQAVRVENNCPYAGVRAESGGQMTATSFEAVRSAALPCPLNTVFADGFESGDTGNWDAVVPD